MQIKFKSKPFYNIRVVAVLFTQDLGALTIDATLQIRDDERDSKTKTTKGGVDRLRNFLSNDLNLSTRDNYFSKNKMKRLNNSDIFNNEQNK